LKLLAALEHGLRQALGADEGHTGLIGKTPHHIDWRTLEPNFEALYDLNELAEYVELPAKMPRRLGIRHGIGRNVELFDQLRFWAYKWKTDFKAKKTQEQWNTAVLSRALDYNNFAMPLGLREVEGIAKSVAKWVWTKYTGRMSDADFSALQSKRGQRKGAKIKQALAGEL
jgi:hypothetical protein